MSNHTPTPWRTVQEYDARHHSIPVLAPWECDGKEPYHPLIVQVLTGCGHADKATALLDAAHIVRCVNSHDALVAALKGLLEKHACSSRSDEERPEMLRGYAALEAAK